MNSFAKHLIEYSEGNLTYKGTNYFNNSGYQIIPGTNFDFSGYNSPNFANDMITYLSDKNIDFAGYIANNGAGIESVITDPSLTAGSIIGGIASAGIIPLLGFGINQYRKGNKKSGLLLSLSGAGLLIPFAGNLIDSGLKISSDNLVTTLLGYKNLSFTSGMFLIGMGAYSIFSAINDYKKDKDVGKAWAKGIFGGLELTAGGIFTYAGFAPMTSLAYEGAGLFSISTAGLSAISSIIPLGIGLAAAGIVAGVTYLVKHLYKWYKSRKAKLSASPSAGSSGGASAAPASTTPAPAAITSPPAPAAPASIASPVPNPLSPSSSPASASSLPSGSSSPPQGSLAAQAAAAFAARNTATKPPAPTSSSSPYGGNPAYDPFASNPPAVPSAPANPAKPSGPPAPPGISTLAPKPSVKPIMALNFPKPSGPPPIVKPIVAGAPSVKPLPKPAAKPAPNPKPAPKPAALIPASAPSMPKTPAAPLNPPKMPVAPTLPLAPKPASPAPGSPWGSTTAKPAPQPAPSLDDEEDESKKQKEIIDNMSAKQKMFKDLMEEAKRKAMNKNP